MRRLFLAVLLAFTLTGCFPPNDNVTDPTPVVPEPIETLEVFEGSWGGVIQFSNTDAFGNVENQSIGILVVVSEQNDANEVVGVLTFDSGIVDGECSVSGGQVELEVVFLAVCEGLEEFSFYGELGSGVLVGVYDAPNLGTPIRDGSFTVSFIGGN